MSNCLQPHDCSLPGSSVQGIFQARILEWISTSFSKGSSPPRDWICVSYIGRWILYHWATQEVSLSLASFNFLLPFFFFKFYFIFKLYNIVLVFPNIKMNPPQVYMCSPSWPLLPPPSPSHPSGSSQCTSPEHLPHASNLDWRSVSHLIIYMFWYCSLRSSHPRLLP